MGEKIKLIEEKLKKNKMDKQRGPSGRHSELCSMLCGSLDGRGDGGEWIHVWWSPCAVDLKLSHG